MKTVLVCVFMCTCRCKHLQAYLWIQRRRLGISCITLCLIWLRRGQLLNLKLTVLVKSDWSLKSQDPPALAGQCYGYRHMPPSLLSCGSWGLWCGSLCLHSSCSYPWSSLCNLPLFFFFSSIYIWYKTVGSISILAYRYIIYVSICP